MKLKSLLILFIFCHNLLLFGQMFKKHSPEDSGVDFKNPVEMTYENNIFNNQYVLNGAGVAIADLDNDGFQDLVFISNQGDSKIYRNKGKLKFEDVTKNSGFDLLGKWGTGVSVVDINSDGLLDLYISVNGNKIDEMLENQFYLNEGDFKFRNATKELGLEGVLGVTNQSVFFDYDKDGDLDLYIMNGGMISDINPNDPNAIPNFTSRNGADKIIDPRDNRNLDFFLRNDNGKFKILDPESIGLIPGENRFGLGLVAADFNEDGWIDIFVSNDFIAADMLYINQKDGTFKESSKPQFKQMAYFSMGADFGDFNNDGLQDIVSVDMTASDNKRLKSNMSAMDISTFRRNIENGGHYEYMYNALHLNNGNGSYSQISHIAGISSTDWSWAPLFADFDNDGQKDLYITNGIKYDLSNSDYNNHLHTPIISGLSSKLIFDYFKAKSSSKSSFSEWLEIHNSEFKNLPILEGEENLFTILGLKSISELSMDTIMSLVPQTKLPNYVFKNNGDLTFDDVSTEWALDDLSFSQGAAYGDLDNDGDLDLVVNNTDDYAFVYENTLNGKNNYLRVRLKGDKGNIDAYNAEVTIYHGNSKQTVEKQPVRGFLSSVEQDLHFGLGKINKIDSLHVDWKNGKITTLRDINSNQVLKVDINNASPLTKNHGKETIFEKSNSKINFVHKENEFDDYIREILIPHKMSRNGASILSGNIIKGGLDDIYLGAPKDQMPALMSQSSFDFYRNVTPPAMIADGIYEDMGGVIFDADNDGDNDLYIVSGGNEWDAGSEMYQDRLYIQENGSWTKSTSALPKITGSGSCAIACDFDNDGDQDLFVGGRQVPGKYPHPGESYLLVNENGKFVDKSTEIAKGLKKVGMVTSAVWSDYDNDNDFDLVIVGEWMPLTIFRNDQNKFTKINTGITDQKTNGWWWSITAADIDGDLDMDYIAGNLGLNYKYQASEEFPFSVYSNDFDQNGKFDIVLSYYNEGKCFPLRGRSCSSQQIPEIKKKFPSYNLFAEATLTDVYGVDKLEKSLQLDAYHYSSSVFINNGDGTFKVKELPKQAQLSTIFGIIPFDFDNDGNLDLLTSGNFHQAEVETPRADASVGLYLKGDGKGNFSSVHPTESGFYATHDVKSMALVPVSRNNFKIVVANNNGPVEEYKFKNDFIKILVSPKEDEVYAIYNFKDGSKRKVEFNKGSSHLTQMSNMLLITDKVDKITVFNSKGESRDIKV